MNRTCISAVILATVAGSPLAPPAERAAAELALLLGDYDPRAGLLDLIAGASSPAAAPRDFFADLVLSLREDAHRSHEARPPA